MRDGRLRPSSAAPGFTALGSGVAKGCAAAALLAALVCPSSATAAWNQPVGGASPINQSDTRSALGPSLASIGGVPYLAWLEPDGTNQELRVARLNGSTNSWEQPWTGVSATYGGINQSAAKDAFAPSLASIGDVPHVAWLEGDGTNLELRVARLNGGTNTWEQPWTGVTNTSGGINQSTAHDAFAPSLASIGGVPHVAWVELDGTNRELRVAVLNTPTNTWGQPWTGVSATDGTINTSTARDAIAPSLADGGGAPWVAWVEPDGTNQELRVARPDELTPTWEQPWTGVSATYGGINQSSAEGATAPSFALIGGLRYVAWLEHEGTNMELRVARVSANTWGQPWTGATATSGGINQSTAQSAEAPSLASIGGVPYVAWVEPDGMNPELRVGRLKGSTNSWEQPWTGVSAGSGGINESTSQAAKTASLAPIGGVPWVAWHEPDDTNDEARISRLEPEFMSQSAVPSATGATLRADLRSYGIPYPVGFQYGSALQSETTTSAAAAGSDNATITKQVGGLTPASAYQFRPFATAGVPAPRVLGTTGAFTTLAASTAPSGGGGAAPADATAAAFSSYRLIPTVFPAAARGTSITQRRRRRPGTRVSYRLSEPATVTFGVERAAAGRRVGRRCRRPTSGNRKRRRCVRYVALRGSFRHLGRAGPSRFRFTGRLRGRKLRPGAYRLRARAVDAAGNASPLARRKFRIVRR